MRSLLLMCLAVPLLGCPEEDRFPFSEPDQPVDDDDTVDPWDNLAPEGSLQGVVVDASTAAPRLEATVTELVSDPVVEAETDAEGWWLLFPTSWEPAQVVSADAGYIGTSVVTDERNYLGIGEPVVMETWPRSSGEEWFDQQFDYAWVPAQGAIFVDVDAPGGAGGVTALLDPEASAGPFVWTVADVAVEGEVIPDNAARNTVVFLGVGPGPVSVTLVEPDGLECWPTEGVTAVADTIVRVPISCHAQED